MTTAEFWYQTLDESIQEFVEAASYLSSVGTDKKNKKRKKSKKEKKHDEKVSFASKLRMVGAIFSFSAKMIYIRRRVRLRNIVSVLLPHHQLTPTNVIYLFCDWILVAFYPSCGLLRWTECRVYTLNGCYANQYVPNFGTTEIGPHLFHDSNV